ncbi:hypothetical protein DRJ17_05095 [Candidatus Woesearchaeota archaeon]|nr:MAG: hypothetical protein DRJ17_05095 [Candidatus Woesearchaeota archaeon]
MVSRLITAFAKIKNSIPEGRCRTGSAVMDWMTGGYPAGRITEIASDPGVGRTTLGLTALRENEGIFIDADHGVTRERVLNIAGRPVTVVRTGRFENVFEIIVKYVEEKNRGVIVVDTIAALHTHDINESENTMQAKYLSLNMPPLLEAVDGSNVAIVLMNQYRYDPGKPGVKVTPGGRALKEYASMRISMRKYGVIRDVSGRRIGHRVMATIESSKICLPSKRGLMDLLWEKGFDSAFEIFYIGHQMGLLKKRGGIIYYNDTPYRYTDFINSDSFEALKLTVMDKIYNNGINFIKSLEDTHEQSSDQIYGRNSQEVR